MQRLTEEDIKEINSNVRDNWNEGVFKEPFGIDRDEKGTVIYQRHETGGASGGNCWGGYPRRYDGEERLEWETLDLVLKKVCPNISYLQYKEIKGKVTAPLWQQAFQFLMTDEIPEKYNLSFDVGGWTLFDSEKHIYYDNEKALEKLIKLC